MNYVASAKQRGKTSSQHYGLGDIVGLHGQSVSHTTRRRIMQMLRKACMVMGPGQKSRIGRLGAGAAVGALVFSFATPVIAQSVGGGTVVDFRNSSAVNRILTGVAAGSTTATSTDAVNGSQMFAGLGSVATSLGGGSKYDPLTGLVTAPAYTVAGGTQSNVGDALAALDKASTAGSKSTTGIISAIGGGASVAADGTVTAPSITVAGNTYNNVTDAVLAAAAGSKLTTAATGTGVVSGTSVAAVGAGDTSTLIAGNNIMATQNGRDVTLAVNPALTGLTSVAITGGPTISASGITGLAGGALSATSTDAVNGSQLFATNQTVTNLANGTSGIVQQANNTAGITVGAGSLGTTVSFANSGGTARVLSGVAAGKVAAGSFDAINGDQLFALSNALGTTVGTGGTIAAPTYTVGGSTYSTVGGAMTAVNTAISGGGIKYFHANSSLSDSAPVGTNSVSIGPVAGSAGIASITVGLNSSAAGNDAIAQGNGASASGTSSIAIGTGNKVSGNKSGAFGDPNTITGTESYAVGNNNTIDADNAFALGNNISIAVGRTGSVGIGHNTTVNAPNTGLYTIVGGTAAAIAPTAVVSIGALGAERQLTNVAAGVVSATSTDAVNGSQMFLAQTATKNTGASLATLIGGGAKIAADGTVQTAPSFTIGGSTYNDVGSAITALASASGGGSGVVKYSNPATPTTPNSGTATNSATLVGAAAASPVNLANVAAGTVTATSTDAVNGSQLFAVKSTADGALQRSGGTMTGGINMAGNVISNLAGPVVASDAANKAYVDSRISVNLLAVQYVADANGAATNTVKLTGNGNGQAVAVTNVAAGKVAAGSTDAVNGGQLYTVQVLASNSLQYDRNTDGSSNYGSASLGGGSAGNTTVLHNVATGVAANDAVNVIQLAASQQATLGLAKDYTDKAFGQLAFDLKEVSKKAYAGTAAAIALQAPGLFEPGTLAMRGGMGYYRGEFALGLSVRATADNGRWSLSGGVAGGRNGGVAASAGIDFVLGR